MNNQTFNVEIIRMNTHGQIAIVGIYTNTVQVNKEQVTLLSWVHLSVLLFFFVLPQCK